ncbi:OFA family MFS transporter [Weissella soli]|uniref:OFA family MFS transporter n=1 Tax=Weissella soli TaxID=155866 RepID=UPI00359FD6EE
MATETKNMDRRWLVIVGTAMVQLGVGTFYAWSIFNTPILRMFHQIVLDKNGQAAAQQPHLGAVSLIFSIGALALALSTIFVARLVRRFGVRRVTIGAGLMFGLSTLVISTIHQASQLWMFYLFAGVVLGAADGIAYMATLSNAIKWYPEKKGLISGIAIAFYGLGSFVFKFIDAAFLGNDVVKNLPTAFIGWGMSAMALILVGALLLRDAPDVAPANQTGTIKNHEFTTAEMLRTPQAYLLFLALFTISLSVFMTGIATNLGTTLAGLSLAEATTVVALIAIANTIGRFVIGALSDKLGRKPMFILSYAATLTAVLVLTFSTQLHMVTFYIAMMVVGFFFGGTITVFPTMVADYFGLKNHSQNYALIYQGFGFGSLAGAVILSFAGGNLHIVFDVYIVLLIISLIIWVGIKKPVYDLK